MAGAQAEYEKLGWMLREGKIRPDAKIHFVNIEEEAKQRIANEGLKPKTRFAMETDDPEIYSRLNAEKDRVIEHVGNKSIAVDLLARAWETLTNSVLDRIMASEEGPR